MQAHLEGSPDDSIQRNTAPVQVVRLDAGERLGKAITWAIPTLVVLTLCCGFSVAFSMLSYFMVHDQMLRDERATEQLRVQVLSQNAILQREGFIRAGDETMGPEGNLQFNPQLLNKRSQ